MITDTHAARAIALDKAFAVLRKLDFKYYFPVVIGRKEERIDCPASSIPPGLRVVRDLDETQWTLPGAGGFRDQLFERVLSVSAEQMDRKLRDVRFLEQRHSGVRELGKVVLPLREGIHLVVESWRENGRPFDELQMSFQIWFESERKKQRFLNAGRFQKRSPVERRFRVLGLSRGHFLDPRLDWVAAGKAWREAAREAGLPMVM